MPRVFDLYLEKVVCFPGSRQPGRASTSRSLRLLRRRVGIVPTRGASSWGHGPSAAQDGTRYVNGYSITPAAQRMDQGDRQSTTAFPSNQGGSRNCSTTFLPASAQASRAVPGSPPMLRSLCKPRLLCHVRSGGRVDPLGCGDCQGRGAGEDREDVLGERRAGEIEKLILGSQPENMQNECRGYLGLLKYWGDLTPHGKASGITEGEAYTSLMLLLRLAQFVNDRWNDLTNKE